MMEFLQTVWNSLTTENPNIIAVISIPFYFVENWISLLLFSTILNISTTKKQQLIYVLLMSSFGIISSFILPSPINVFANVVAFFFSGIFILKTTIFKSLISLIVPFIFNALIQSIFTKLYTSIFNIDYLVGSTIPLHRFILASISYLFLFLIYFMLKHKNINISKLQLLDKKKKVLFILSIIFGLILIGLQIYMVTFYVSYLPLFVTILNLVSLIAYMAISLYSIFNTSKLETTSTSLEEAQLYNKTLEILQDNTRAFRHDFSNILQGMVGYIDNNDMEGLKKYYSQLVEDISHTNNLTTLSPKVVNNPAIYNVLATKYHKADSLGIKINLEAFLDLNELHMKIYEFTRILGILMDNAIEATSECDDKIINVTFRKDNKKHMQLLIIENTYKNKDIDTEKIYEKGFSTKKNNTGLGLWEIRQILKKNNNLNLFTTKNDKYFSQQFEIYY